MIRLELYNQNYDSKINEFPMRNAILRIYYLIKDNIEQETFAPMLVLPPQNTHIWTDILMLHLRIDSEILAAAAAVRLRLSGRNKSQTDSCFDKSN